MRQPKKRALDLIGVFIILLALVFSASGYASKLELESGMFIISSSSRATPLSNIGSYRVAYKYSILSDVDLGAGYTLIATGGFGGDLAYGFDIVLAYFPFSSGSANVWEDSHFTLTRRDLWRPYISASFNQRQFQSISTNYSGPGAEIGVERRFFRSVSLKGAARYILLSGPTGSSATEIDTLLGLSIQF